MRLLSIFACAGAISLASFAALAADAKAFAAPLEIRVEAGDWGEVERGDIATVLASVADVLAPHFPSQGPRRISVARSAAGPRVLADEPGAHRVFLDVRDARWDQFAYQFAHELCHVFTHHEHRQIAPGTLVRDHQWFEEALCEAVSLYALERVAARWETSPPYPDWQPYAPAFREYAQELRAAPHRQLAPGETLPHWFALNRASLERDPYLRQKNELLAVRLLSLLETVPDSLAAIGYLNAEAAAPPASMAAYFDAWLTCCPPAQRAFVVGVTALLYGQGRIDPGAPL